MVVNRAFLLGCWHGGRARRDYSLVVAASEFEIAVAVPAGRAEGCTFRWAPLLL